MAVKTGPERPRSGRRRLELRPEELRRHLDPGRLHFASTAEGEPLVGTIGQPRAFDALEYGLAVETRGFNLFVSGLPGSGRLTTVLDYLRALAGAKPVPADWIYVYDFGNPDCPNAISMPAGRGAEFTKAMDEFVEVARREIPRAFESEEYSAVPIATLRPEPIPLDLKVVLLGSPLLYHLLHQLDEDFRELFKVKADFSPELDWTSEHHRNYAAFVSRWVRENDLRHFDIAAVARLIEHGERLRENQRKLSARLIEISDLVSEARFWTEAQGHPLVQASDVDLASRKKEFRSNLLEERVRELIQNGTIVIATDGERIGQVNGIAILDQGDYSFARPSRVSARVSLGRGGIESIEREIELSGPIHSKGFMILSGYLAATDAQDYALAVSATLFEQSYDEIEGDSASSTELYALLSALSELPLAQGIAVTGSVDQNGQVQAVGGVTRKIEGFYATCKAQGLTGAQGVIIPAANIHNLMLDQEVVDAVRDGKFHVWAVRIDEGIELLTGCRAGRRRADGSYPPDSVHGLVAARLLNYAERLRAFAEPEAETDRDGRPYRAQKERRR